MSAILDQLRKQQPHPMFAARKATHPATVVRTPAARPVRVTVAPAAGAAPMIPAVTYAQIDALGEQVPEGYYALPRKACSTDGNDITFFQVRTLRGGKRQIRQVLGGPGGWQYQTLPAKFQYVAYLHILDDVKGAQMLFADKVRCCYRCKSPLTNAHSREVGLGPDCEKK